MAKGHRVLHRCHPIANTFMSPATSSLFPPLPPATAFCDFCRLFRHSATPATAATGKLTPPLAPWARRRDDPAVCPSGPRFPSQRRFWAPVFLAVSCTEQEDKPAAIGWRGTERKIGAHGVGVAGPGTMGTVWASPLKATASLSTHAEWPWSGASSHHSPAWPTTG